MTSKTIFVAAVILIFAMHGQSRAEVIEIARGDSRAAPKQPQIAVSENGTVHIVFAAKNSLLYSQIAVGQHTATPPITVADSAVYAVGMRRGPRIAVTNDSICISAIGGEQGKGRDGDVHALRSTDDGRTWSSPTMVNDVSGSAREGLHAMAASPLGQLCAVWLDLRSMKTEIYAATSDDGGKHWNENTLVYRSPDGSVCECCHPSVAYDPRGNIHVMWRNSVRGARDMYVAQSKDGGSTFQSAAKLGSGTWKLNACPMDGGYLAIALDGTMFTVWRRETELFLTRDETHETLLGKGRQPWIASSTAGPIVVWLEDRSGALKLLSPKSRSPEQIANKAVDPVVASSIHQKARSAVAWEELDADMTVLKCMILD